ncbi:peptidoglycan-binding domain-containing protein [Duganella sp. FT135W]|uniref:Peptidoglycan-binding domain-containing protein n=1 Tax=Duganella flavida TaxID=2692175 RepID=A0A6L8K7Z1_9BURK|nr:peptidoglycan-binding domain-containing protein [Duganella flavida]MYM23563.1 peptidoglycan-binding domain-containing protein [Duganella flavida]
MTTHVTKLSGAHWVRRFDSSSNTRDLSGMFRYAVEDFIAAMTAAGIKVSVSATYRPLKRSYLMHWSWRIVNDGIDPSSIPSVPGVDIEWVHPTTAASVNAAREMVEALSIRRLRTKPALRSQHNAGLAVDMSICWRGAVSIKDATGALVQIKTGPRTGMNKQLIEVGATYGVKKYYDGIKDVPHWSNNGR